jgi:central kinetochore subunit Mal2/MCM21
MNENLLGVRIDVCVRGGRFAKPYYVLLRRERVSGEKDVRLRVHRHTVPAFIDLVRMEGVYLPFPPGTGRAEGEESGSGSDGEGEWEMGKGAKGRRRQDLRGFVRELRRELVAWHLRGDAVELLREKLGLSEDALIDPAERLSPEARGGIVALAATAVEARYVRLEWEDGRVGRFKLSNAGFVERAVVIGDDGRDKQTEDTMTGGGGRVETLLERLRERSSVVA